MATRRGEAKVDSTVSLRPGPSQHRPSSEQSRVNAPDWAAKYLDDLIVESESRGTFSIAQFCCDGLRSDQGRCRLIQPDLIATTAEPKTKMNGN